MVLHGGNGKPVDQAGAQFGTDQRSPDTDRRNARYRMTTDLAAQDDDFQILNDAGEVAYRLSGHAMTHHDTIQIENMRGGVICSALVRAARKQERIDISDGAGREIGSVVRRPVSALRDRFSLELRHGPVLTIEGNVSTHEFSIVGQSGSVADVSRRWFRAKGSYGVEIVRDQDDALLLTTVVVLDHMIRATT